jgi:hypothetical protein
MDVIKIQLMSNVQIAKICNPAQPNSKNIIQLEYL